MVVRRKKMVGEKMLQCAGAAVVLIFWRGGGVGGGRGVQMKKLKLVWVNLRSIY